MTMQGGRAIEPAQRVTAFGRWGHAGPKRWPEGNECIGYETSRVSLERAGGRK